MNENTLLKFVFLFPMKFLILYIIIMQNLKTTIFFIFYHFKSEDIAPSRGIQGNNDKRNFCSNEISFLKIFIMKSKKGIGIFKILFAKKNLVSLQCFQWKYDIFLCICHVSSKSFAVFSSQVCTSRRCMQLVSWGFL